MSFDNRLLAHESVYQGLGPGRIDRRRGVDRESIDRWKASMDGEQERQILAVAGATMEALGYSTQQLPSP